MKNAAFVTYNLVGRGILDSGWHEGSENRRALVVQNTRGVPWGARESVEKPCGEKRNSLEYVRRVCGEIESAWGKLQEALPALDHIIVYVGARGSENAIALAAQLPEEKVTFVMCDCGWDEKLALIEEAGMSGAGVVECDCGGHDKMHELLQKFMRYGSIPERGLV